MIFQFKIISIILLWKYFKTQTKEQPGKVVSLDFRGQFVQLVRPVDEADEVIYVSN